MHLCCLLFRLWCRVPTSQSTPFCPNVAALGASKRIDTCELLPKCHLSLTYNLGVSATMTNVEELQTLQRHRLVRLSALRLHVALVVAKDALSLIVVHCFHGRCVLYILAVALDAVAFAFAVFALALRIPSATASVGLSVHLCCSLDLDNLLLHLIPSFDPGADPHSHSSSVFVD